MFQKRLSPAVFTLVIVMSFSMLSTSCARRVVAAPAQPVNVNVGTSAPQQHVPTSRKEIRILKKARKSGVY